MPDTTVTIWAYSADGNLVMVNGMLTARMDRRIASSKYLTMITNPSLELGNPLIKRLRS